MSKFINTTYRNTVDNLIDASNSKLNNNLYKYNGDKPVTIEYYNINSKLSTVDPSTGYAYKDIGNNSGFRFNLIHDLIVYGDFKIEADLQRTDFGIESNSIEGTFKILPNTIIPCPNDFFAFKQIKQKLLFKVTNVTNDTAENGHNFYKIEFKLDKLSSEDIDKQVVKEFVYMVENQGTNLNPIVEDTNYKLLQNAEEVMDRLKEYYKELFYKDRVQTFILNHNGFYFYDPYLISFIMKHNLINTNEDYLYICQQIVIPENFNIKYNKTFLRFIEVPDKANIEKYYIYSQGIYIDDIFSILHSRPEDYFRIDYTAQNNINPILSEVINNFDSKLVEKIINKSLYNEDDIQSYRNIILNYIIGNEAVLTQKMLDDIDNIEFTDTIFLFYEIPIVIFILEKYIRKLLALTS